jgi:hypothetical protein
MKQSSGTIDKRAASPETSRIGGDAAREHIHYLIVYAKGDSQNPELG